MQLFRSLTPCLFVALLLAACSSGTNGAFRSGDAQAAGVDASEGTDVFSWDVPQPDLYVNPNVLVVDVEPNHGPFVGGNTVLVRGSNFTPTAMVTFGGALVQPADTTLTDTHRLSVQPPAGNPGFVDVAVTTSSMTSTLSMAYHYDAIYPLPNIGSTAGGDQIVIHGLGTNFSNATTVTMEGLPCVVVSVTDPETLSCTTPAQLPGLSDVTVVTGTETIAVQDAYTYSDNSDNITDALGGGPIAGAINVVVIAGDSGNAIPGAYVFLGDDPTIAPPQSGLTDSQGRLTFSYPGLVGPQDLTASAHCYSSHTMQAFDAADVLIYLYPMQTAACGMGSPPGSSNAGQVYAAEIQGELVWTGFNEYTPNPWDNIPEPRAGERRVAFVYTTQSDLLSANPPPGDGGTVFETIAPGYGGIGYPYNIVARPAALAVYALAGLENIETQAFVPYIMGVARGVLASPRARLVQVDIQMNITLNHETDVSLHGVPTAVNNQPDTLEVQAFVDLGGEGVIVRTDNTAMGTDPTAVYPIVAMPGLTGPLADAAVTVQATYGTTQNFNPPLTVTIVTGIRTPDDPVDLTAWAGIPDFTVPYPNGLLPPDRTVRFDLDGPDPEVFWMSLSGALFYWETFAPGSARTFQFPDLSVVTGLSDLPAGQPFYMNVYGLNVPGVTFNHFDYSYLSQLYWSSYSLRQMVFAR